MQPAAAALIVAASVNLTLPSAARAEATPPYRAKRLLLGCWTHTAAHISQQGFHGSTVRCFQEGRAIGGVFFESSGHGGDVCERWRIDAQRVVIWDYGDRRQSCLYALSEDRRTLTLRDCPAAGEWRRSDGLGRRSWPCRSR